MHEEPIPQPSAGEVQVQIKSVGVCASDVHYYRDGRIGTTVVTDPLVIGHEASGVVTAVGKGVTELEIGQRVAIEPAKPCMKCEYCLSGHYNVCPGIPFFGTPPTDGCFREYIAWPASLVLPVPDSLSFDEAAMVEPLAIGVYVAELAKPKADETVLILGAGAIGLSVLQAVTLQRAGQVIVAEPVPERRKMAVGLGAVEAVDSSLPNYEDEMRRLTDGRGADVVIECTGEEEAVRQSPRLAAVLGRVLVVGIPDGNDYLFEASTSRRKQLSVLFVRRSNLTTERSIDLVADGKVEVASYATHHFPLEKAGDALELAMAKGDGVLRAIIAVGE